MPRGVTVAQVILDHFVMVRIHARQPSIGWRADVCRHDVRSLDQDFSVWGAHAARVSRWVARPTAALWKIGGSPILSLRATRFQGSRMASRVDADETLNWDHVFPTLGP